jgi:hypothetical protein
MAQWRRFERADGHGAGVEFREIRREGIRCLLRWSVSKSKAHGTTSVLDNEEHARRHEAKKAAEWIRKGFVEVAPVEKPIAGRISDADAATGTSATADADVRVLDVVKASAKHYEHPGFDPVAGFAETYRCELTPGHPLSHHSYYVLRDGGRSAISFNVRADAHDSGAVAAFLEFVTAHRDLPFDGASHHKTALPSPVGRFGHVLFCAPALGRSHVAYPEIAERVASVFPVFDCEVGNADTEVLVDARMRGHGSLPYTRWDREPQPVMDVRFDITPSRFRRAVRKFLVYRPSDLERLLGALSGADEGSSWLEVRDFRGEVRRFTPGSAPTYPEAMASLRTGFTDRTPDRDT